MKNEVRVSRAFGKQSVVFDELYDSNPIVGYMRKMIREEVLLRLNPGDHIFEVNAGTGTDAIFFAKSGYRVTALEISADMVEKAKEKVRREELNDKVTFVQRSYEHVQEVDGQYDYLYSNFGGLNCTPDLSKILEQLIHKLRPGGQATLTILPPFTLWEKLYFLKGNLKIATRRKSKGPSIAHIEGEYFNCWYYNPEVITRALKGRIKEVSVTGLCIFAPPSFLRSFPTKYPTIFKWLTKIDQAVSKLPFFNRIGDYFMISFTKV